MYKGIEESWNFRFPEAKKVFQWYEGRGDIRHTLHKLELSIFKVLITGKKSLIEKCMTKIIKYEEQLNNIKQNEIRFKETKPRIKLENHKFVLNTTNLNNDISNEVLEILMTETLMFKGVLRFLSGHKFKAFLIFRECWKIYRKYETILLKYKLSNDQRERFDGDFKSRLYLGLGLFYLGISVLPRNLTTLIRIVGFTSGNREKGLDYLTKCMDEGYSRSPYASLIILLFHVDKEP